MSRLGGKSLKFDKKLEKPDGVIVAKYPSMDAAINRLKTSFQMKQFIRKWNHPELRYCQLPGLMLNGNDEFDSIMAMSDQLIDEAIVEDPRLCKKAAWVRGEEGIDACPLLLGSGDDRPYFERKKLRLAESATTESVQVVISTDSKEITAEHAAAFIATARLAQQFRPLEIWWQGAWMHDQYNGLVFLVPLIQGDCDFRRLQFVIGSRKRDSASFYIMVSKAVEDGVYWEGEPAERSYLENTFAFVRETGLLANGYSVASNAAHWAGMDPMWKERISESSAAQSWEPPTEHKWVGATDEDRARWKRQEEEEKRLKELKAKERLLA